MKIVICDDSIESLFIIERLVAEYADENNIDCEIEKYSDSNKLCENIEKENLGDIYILSCRHRIFCGRHLCISV